MTTEGENSTPNKSPREKSPRQQLQEQHEERKVPRQSSGVQEQQGKSSQQDDDDDDVRRSPRRDEQQQQVVKKSSRDEQQQQQQQQRVVKKSPRDDQQRHDDDVKRSPRRDDQQQQQRVVKKSPRDEQQQQVVKKSPRDDSSSSLMSSLRKANLTIERENSIDIADAVIERATREHQTINISDHNKSTPLAKRLQSIDEDKQNLKEVMNLTTPAKQSDKQNNILASQDVKNATVVGVVNDEVKFLPKPSDEVTLNDDVDALLGLVKKTKEKKPLSDKYLKMLEKTKKKTSTRTPPRRRTTRYDVTTEASRISQILNKDDSRWGNPRSSIQFKSHYEEQMFRSMQKVLIGKNKCNKKKKKRGSSDAKSTSPHSPTRSSNTFDRLSQPKKQDNSLFYIQNESGKKFASFDGEL